MEQAVVTDQITSAIDALAADLMVQDDAGAARQRWASSLLELTGVAREGGCDRIAGIAESAARRIDDAALDIGVVPDVLEQSLTALRDALATEHSRPLISPAPAANTVPAIADDPELMADFILESREHLECIEAQVLSLEQDAHNTEALHATFRSFHTIKGLAGFLELPLIQEVAHEVETVLDRARQGEFEINPNAIDVILASKDYIGAWLKHLDTGRRENCPKELALNRPLLTRVRSLLADSTVLPISEPVAPQSPVAAVETPVSSPQPSRETRSTKESNRAVKVDTAKLDYLVDMVGEMVIAQSLVRHDPDLIVAQNQRLARNLSQLTRITDEVQRTAMSMRMVPIGPLFQKMARLVRDLGRKFGKQVQFESEGEDVELDRNIVEELADPLMHMVRNAIDHGIESPGERTASSKTPTARISLRAFHRSGQIVIEVADDGKGIDRDKILAKARSIGLVSQHAALSDTEILNLIFNPGFSTADKVSDVSGRGVGMDVVRKQILKLRGSVDIESNLGQGTTFSLRLPLTLAIIDGLVVAVGEKRYIIPLASVKEMLRPTPEMIATVENRAEMVLIRDRVVPMVRLHERFDVAPRSHNPAEAVLIVADLDGASFCLMVDELIGKQEVVIKSLGPMFRSVACVAGGAILGDGTVGLILDLSGLFGGRGDA